MRLYQTSAACMITNHTLTKYHLICSVPPFCLQLVGEDAGADCSSLDSVDQPQVWPAGKQPATKPRFQVRSTVIAHKVFEQADCGILLGVKSTPQAVQRAHSWQLVCLHNTEPAGTHARPSACTYTGGLCG